MEERDGGSLPWVVQTDPSGPPKLNSAKAVEGVVREMLERVFTAAADVSDGSIPSDQGTHAAAEAARHAAVILSGESEEYDATIPWFSHSQLGAYLKERFGIETPADDVINAYLLEQVRAGLQLVRRIGNRELDPSLGLKLMDLLVERATEALLGMTPAGLEHEPKVVFDVGATPVPVTR